jgi:hypothetical protein
MNRRLQTFEMIDDRIAEALRQKRMPSGCGVSMLFWNSARAILKAAIRTEHPDWSLDQIHVEVARRISNGAIDNVPT